MPESSYIEHAGVIAAINGDSLEVLLNPLTACGSCDARHSCPVLEVESGKVVDVVRGAKDRAVGDQVVVILEPAKGRRAVFFGYTIPFLLLFGALIVGSAFFKSELVAGLLAMAILVPYYGVLYFLRGKIKKAFVFRLKDDQLR